MRALALRTVSLLTLAILGSISATRSAHAQDGTDEQFGKVHFQTSCNEVAQRRFDRGMRYQHSFWYRPAKEIFEETLQADPECAIAYWGIALSLLYNPHFPAPKENLTEGLGALQKAKALGAKSERERDYIDALLAFYSGDEKTTFGQRAQAYLKSTEAVAARYPDDDEAQIAYAITLNVTASPNDKTYANQLKGAAILEPIFKRQPRHPGVAHYLIHLYDYPAIAERGLDAAKRYSEIAPAAPHALHMPSHIFTRVGYWNESIDANSRSAKAAKEGKDPSEQLHADDYMVYALLQLAQDSRARDVVADMVATTGYAPRRPRRSLRDSGQSGTLYGRARRLAGRCRPEGRAEPVRLRRCDHLFRPRPWRRALRQCRRSNGGHRQAGGAAGQAAAGQGRLLG